MADCDTATNTERLRSVTGVGDAMESWLLEVKRVRIPRPKFQTRYPTEPPKDYYACEDKLNKRDMIDKATEDLRKAIHEKL
ncbi:hypothetical protein M8J76_004144 [Diaphorina citri]|nr:hypothetical protein M8J75_004416 [Diaphorina citri]KAI5736516.1 hypothetical protein M8J76_004144 [Diaphorina citri]